MFLSRDGSKIFIVLYSPKPNLELAAEKDKLTKRLELSTTDLLSLEPVDAKLRPLRFKKKQLTERYLSLASCKSKGTPTNRSAKRRR